MKIYHLLLAAAVSCCMSSCFKDEPLNAECDIEQAYVHADDPTEIFFAASDTLVNVPYDVTDITFEIKEGSDVSAMAPVFKITEGATIEPASGTVHDFSDGKSVVYKVTSQDGQWTKTYNVSFKSVYQSVYPVSEYSFENFRLTDGANGGQYYEWSDLTSSGEWAGNWATGNPGFNISCRSSAPDEYPSSPTSDGYQGSAVKLTTRDTGIFGIGVNMRIAAGNLFIGYFDLTKALTQTMQATNFGRPFDQEPLEFTGWYRYRPGEEYQDRSGTVHPDTVDRGDIYAVLYLNHDEAGNAFVLHGDDVLTSPQIVALARVPEVQTTDEWTKFDIDFEYYKDIDRQLLADRGYNLAVVFTSSIEGASFCGAVGSTLYIDEVKVICAETNE